MKNLIQTAACVALLGASIAPHAAGPQRVTLSGELIDTWCYTSGIMYAEGTAHHRCAVWCAVGGIPVSLLAEDGNIYTILKIEEDTTNVANPRLMHLQTHKVTVDGDLFQRDGVNYLLISQVVDDHGIVNFTHKERGIQ